MSIVFCGRKKMFRRERKRRCQLQLLLLSYEDKGIVREESFHYELSPVVLSSLPFPISPINNLIVYLRIALSIVCELGGQWWEIVTRWTRSKWKTILGRDYFGQLYVLSLMRLKWGWKNLEKVMCVQRVGHKNDSRILTDRLWFECHGDFNF